MPTREEILAVLKAQHDAIDSLFALAISLDRKFMPTKSGHVWDVCLAGNELIKKLEVIEYPTTKGA